MNETRFIENAELKKCPKCQHVIYVDSSIEGLFKNITFLFIDKTGRRMKTKCRHCHEPIEINLNEIIST